MSPNRWQWRSSWRESARRPGAAGPAPPPAPCAGGRRPAPPRPPAPGAGPSAPPVLVRGGLRLDPAARSVTCDGRAVDLARREFAVLEELMRADGGVVSADRLLTRVWDDSYADPFENTVRVTVMRLRRKLGEPSPVETVVGSGYRMR